MNWMMWISEMVREAWMLREAEAVALQRELVSVARNTPPEYGNGCPRPLSLAQPEPRAIAALRNEFAAKNLPTSPTAASNPTSTYGPDWFAADGVGVIPLWGVMRRSDGQVSDSFGRFGTSMEGLSRALAATEADQSIHSRVFVVDSPGGSAIGMQALAEAIHASAARKPLATFVEGGMYSAALYAGVQASRVVTQKDRGIGSIGTYTVMYDFEKMLGDMGVKANLISSGGVKGMGAFGLPVTDELKAEMKKSVDALQAMFTEAVARGRGMSGEAAGKLATGQEWIGQQGVAVGLADEVGTLAGLMADLRATYGQSVSGFEQSGAVRPTPSFATQSAAEIEVSMSQVNTAGAAALALAAAAGGVVGAGGEVPVVQAGPAGADILANERKRVAEISAITGKFPMNLAVAKIGQDAIAGGESVESVRGKVLDAMATAAPVAGPGPSVEVGQEAGDKVRSSLALVLAAKATPKIESRILAGGESCERMAIAMGYESGEALRREFRASQGSGLRRFRMIEIAEACALGGLNKLGQRGRWGDTDSILAAVPGHSTGDFPLLTANVMGKVLIASYSEAPTNWRQWCDVGSANDFKAASLISLSELPNLKEIFAGEQPQEASVNERAESLSLKTYGRRFSLGRKLFYNDDLSGLAKYPAMWGTVAARVPEDLAYAILTGNPAMADGYNLFDNTNHFNLPSGAALAMASLDAAITVMKTQRGFGPDRAELDIMPKFLHVPTNLRGVANALYTSENDPLVTAANSNSPNIVRGLVKPIDSPRLYRASTSSWYLTGEGAVQVNFLEGRQVPIIVQVGNGSILSQDWEIIFDCNAGAVRYEAFVKGN